MSDAVSEACEGVCAYKGKSLFRNPGVPAICRLTGVLDCSHAML